MKKILYYLFVAMVMLFVPHIASAATHIVVSIPQHFGVFLGSGVARYGAPSVVMATAALSTGNLTLADWAKRLDPDGKVPVIAELLNQTNEILLDMVWKEGNLPTGHRTTVRTGLPAVFWRLLNQGVSPSKSKTAQIDEGCGMLEAWSEVDKDLALLNGNVNAFRLSEARAFLEAMSQELARVLFYGNNGATPEQFNGLAVRYSDSTAQNTDNIIKGGGVGSDNTSIYLIGWDDETIHGIFPKGSKAGIIHEDKGEQIVYGANGMGASRLVALVDHFQWKAGIALKDWRYVVRICNIDISDLNAANVKTIINAMEQAAETIGTGAKGLGKPVFYANRTIRRFLRREARESVGTGGGLTFENFAGQRVLMFGDIPVRRSDALLNTEALVA